MKNSTFRSTTTPVKCSIALHCPYNLLSHAKKSFSWMYRRKYHTPSFKFLRILLTPKATRNFNTNAECLKSMKQFRGKYVSFTRKLCYSFFASYQNMQSLAFVKAFGKHSMFTWNLPLRFRISFKKPGKS